MTTSHRDLAQPDPWQRSIERSLHRRAIAPQVRRSVARRRRASVALSTLMVAGPTGSLLAAAGLGGRADVAQASPASRAIDTGAPPAALAFELGSRGDAVAEIQRQLGVPVDGIFGPITHAAVTDFQARNGLDVDGIVGPVTWTALFGLEQAAAAAGASDGSVAVILRERGERTAGTGTGTVPGAGAGAGAGAGEGAAEPSEGPPTAPAVGGDGPVPGVAPDTDAAPHTAPPTRPVSAPAPANGACGPLRLTSPVRGTLTSPYGPRWGRNHDGIDIAAPTGTPIRAAECGVVSFAGSQGGYGNMVCVKHSSRFETCYAHMTRSAVAQGQRVERGQVIGYVGCTGSCTGPHLHFETRVDGAARDPRPYLAGGSVPGTPTVKAATKAKLTASIRKDVVRARTTAKATTLAQPQATTGLAPAHAVPVASTGTPDHQATAPIEPAYSAPAEPTPSTPAPPVQAAPDEPTAYAPSAEPVYEAPAEPTYSAPVDQAPVEPAPVEQAPVAPEPAAPAEQSPVPELAAPVAADPAPAPAAAAPAEPPSEPVTATPEPAAVAPPIEPPPVETPPVETPPAETPPAEAPPIQIPPTTP